ncbi:MAG: bifunctional adenosylcobinamide kinase/adenosylcobinamide-phosphate guanylyltransferase, partial [Alphaproteobacteria bacterium]
MSAPHLLVIGGARSGKSRYAQQRAEATRLRRIFIATAQAFDAE